MGGICPNFRQRLEVFSPFRYHLGFEFQGLPVFFSGRPQWWQPLHKLGLAITFAGAVLAAAAVQAKEAASILGTVALAQLPAEAQDTERLIRAGGPFAHSKDGSVFGNRERVLARQPRGFYREYTVKTPGSRDRGARRIVCGGRQPANPEACFYTDDHYASFRLIVK
jgi:ribonuclease T1